MYRRINNSQKGLNTISDKTKELGLKMNINKTKLMAIKSEPPATNICIDVNPIEWVNTYMYLGIHIDAKLTFKEEVTYFRERAKTRLTTMKSMTSLKEGANIACTRSLIDYAAPVLHSIYPNQLESL